MAARSPFTFSQLSQEEAEEIAEWHYPEPYSFYDWTADADDLRELLDPALRGEAYWAVRDEEDELVGHFSLKPKGDTVEIGLGLRPDLTGRGLGAAFLAAGLDFGRTRFAPQRFTLAVATFNERAIKVYERAGFTRKRIYLHSTNGGEWEFLEMSRPA
ncbi:MAG TPA: GNAT family protein [Gaiellaceae bacterium]|nr:GNAT family protein [Gaiellaceae bacterium]